MKYILTLLICITVIAKENNDGLLGFEFYKHAQTRLQDSKNHNIEGIELIRVWDSFSDTWTTMLVTKDSKLTPASQNVVNSSIHGLYMISVTHKKFFTEEEKESIKKFIDMSMRYLYKKMSVTKANEINIKLNKKVFDQLIIVTKEYNFQTEKAKKLKSIFYRK